VYGRLSNRRPLILPDRRAAAYSGIRSGVNCDTGVSAPNHSIRYVANCAHALHVLSSFQRAVARVDTFREVTRDHGAQLEGSRQIVARLPQSHDRAYLA